LNNREIAELLGITIDGVKKAKQRLRKKVGALPGDNIPQISPSALD
jgi:DNA-directed RNA polymerase specialized sigma24 family protein